jgi:hypothetical protein
MKQLIFLATILVLLSGCNGCQQIPANQIILNSSDYGKTWNKVTGTVPRCGLPGCYNLYLPATTMGGELSSIQRVGKTGESAKVKILYTYQWEIVDPIKFVTEAKELRGGGDYTSDSSLETIEGRLIDRKFHDVSATLLVEEDVKNFDQSLFEGKLNNVLNQDLSNNYGVRISAISVVPEFGEQLETALDAAQVLEVYKSLNEEALGKEVIKNKAGATKIIINQNKDKE